MFDINKCYTNITPTLHLYCVIFFSFGTTCETKKRIETDLTTFVQTPWELSAKNATCQLVGSRYSRSGLYRLRSSRVRVKLTEKGEAAMCNNGPRGTLFPASITCEIRITWPCVWDMLHCCIIFLFRPSFLDRIYDFKLHCWNGFWLPVDSRFCHMHNSRCHVSHKASSLFCQFLFVCGNLDLYLGGDLKNPTVAM